MKMVLLALLLVCVLSVSVHAAQATGLASAGSAGAVRAASVDMVALSRPATAMLFGLFAAGLVIYRKRQTR